MRTDQALVRGLTLRCQAAEAKQKHPAVDVAQGKLVLQNCHITSDSLPSVFIHGSEANPTIRRCQIHDNRSSNVQEQDNFGIGNSIFLNKLS